MHAWRSSFDANMINFQGNYAALAVSELKEVCALHALVCFGDTMCRSYFFLSFISFGHWPNFAVFILNKTLHLVLLNSYDTVKCFDLKIAFTFSLKTNV